MFFLCFSSIPKQAFKVKALFGWAFELVFASAKAKSQAKGSKDTTAFAKKQLFLQICFSAAFGLNIYPPATGYDGYRFVFISSFPIRVASFFSYPCHEEVRAQ